MLARALHLGPLVLAIAACALLVIAEFSTLYEIKVITVVKETETAGDHHGYALAIIGAAAVLMAWGATVGSSRAAAVALLVLAIAALAVVFAVDFPDVDEEGFIGVAFEQAKATPKSGFYLESLGATALLLSGAAALLFGRSTRGDEPRAEAATSIGPSG